ncbi:MAG: hypothetical protein AAFY70_02185 [Bacteroidota bacterium]
MWIRWILCGIACVFIQPTLAQSDNIFGLFDQYDVIHYDLDIQVSHQIPRIAGTVKIQFETTAPLKTLLLNMGPQLEIASLTWSGRKLPYEFLGEFLKISFPLTLSRGKVQELRIVYFGDLKSESEYPVWERNTRGQVQASLVEARIPSYYWWPCKAEGDDSADSMSMRILFPEEEPIFATGREVRVTEEPGRFLQHQFQINHSIRPQEVKVLIGSFETIEEVFEGLEQNMPLTYFIQPGQNANAKAHLKQVRRILKGLEQYWGTYPAYSEGYQWFQPMGQQSSFLRNNKWGFDPLLVRDIARKWVSTQESPQDSNNRWFYQAFIQYAPVLLIEYNYDKKAAREYMDAQDQEFAQTGALFHSLRYHVGNDPVFFAAMKSFLEQPVEVDFLDHVERTLGKETFDFMSTYIEAREVPIIEYYTERQRKKLTFSYRLIGPKNLVLPFQVIIGDEFYTLEAGREWQSSIYKGAGVQKFSVQKPDIWCEIQEVNRE